MISRADNFVARDGVGRFGGMHMSDDEDAGRSEADEAIEREIRNSRKFTLEEAIALGRIPSWLRGKRRTAERRPVT